MSEDFSKILDSVKAGDWKIQINEALKCQCKCDFINCNIYLRGMFFNHSKIYKAEGRIEFVEGKSTGIFIINDELYKLTTFKEETNKVHQFNL